MSEEWAKYGLLCQHIPTIQTLSYEAPINITSGIAFFGECSVGAFSYLNGASSFTNTDIGRYCSGSSDIICGPGEHDTSALSTHPFIGETGESVTGLARFPSYAKLIARRNTPRVAPATTSLSTNWHRISIGHDVWIGTRAVILAGIKIAPGAVIAAGAVVTRDVDPYTIVGGVPAKPIRTRFEPTIIERLLELSWWDYDLSPIVPSLDFNNVEECIEIIRHTIKKGIVKELKPERWRMTREGSKINIKSGDTLDASIELERTPMVDQSTQVESGTGLPNPAIDEAKSALKEYLRARH